MSKISVGESFTVALFSGGEKVYGQEGGRKYQDFPSNNFSLTLPKISVGNPLLLDYIGVPKVWIRGVSIKTFRQKCFLSHSAETFPREYFIVAIISRTEKVWTRGGGEYQAFPSKIFVSHCRKPP